MEKLLADDRFLNRYFSEEEIRYIRSKGKGAAQTMAKAVNANMALFRLKVARTAFRTFSKTSRGAGRTI